MIENFGQNVARLRKEQSMSQEDLADKLGVTKQTISNIERGTRYPTFEALGKIADILNASPMDLFGTLKEIAVYDTNATLDRIDKYDSQIRSIMQIQKNFNKIESFEESLRYINEHLNPLIKEIPTFDDDGIPHDIAKYERSSITKIWNLATTLNSIDEKLGWIEKEDLSYFEKLEKRIDEMYQKIEEIEKFDAKNLNESK